MAAEYDFIETTDGTQLVNFLEEKSRYYWHVVASNAFVKEGDTYYYALIEKNGAIEDIKSSLSSIDSNTSS